MYKMLHALTNWLSAPNSSSPKAELFWQLDTPMFRTKQLYHGYRFRRYALNYPHQVASSTGHSSYPHQISQSRDQTHQATGHTSYPHKIHQAQDNESCCNPYPPPLHYHASFPQHQAEPVFLIPAPLSCSGDWAMTGALNTSCRTGGGWLSSPAPSMWIKIRTWTHAYQFAPILLCPRTIGGSIHAFSNGTAQGIRTQTFPQDTVDVE